MGAALTAMAVSLALLAYPAYLGIKAVPAAVDLRHHHRSDRSTALRRAVAAARRATPIRSPMPASTPPSSSARPIPTSGPLATNATPQATYDAALAVVNKRKWRVVDARAPQAGRREGHIEAVARTPIMGFRDDVVDPRPGRDRRRAHRRALLLALRLVRFRHQCIARARVDERRSKMPSAPKSRSVAGAAVGKEIDTGQERSDQEVDHAGGHRDGPGSALA